MKSPSLRATIAAATLAAAAAGFAPPAALAQSSLLDPAPLGGDARMTNRAPANAVAQARSNVAGRYAPLREGGKDTGCMITLEPSGKAQLAPACRDQGLVIFDPVNWRMEQGRLSLTARKGHRAHFDRQGDGTWLRDPKEGKALALRPI